MKKSFLFNISEQGGLPGGPNEVNNNIMGSISIDQQAYTSNNNLPVYMDLDDDEIEQYRKGGWVVEEYNTGGVIKHQGWEYKNTKAGNTKEKETLILQEDKVIKVGLLQKVNL
jgi:hypothetical protein